MNYSADIKKLPRFFLPKDFSIVNWESLEPYFESLLQRPISSLKDLEKWLQDASELEAVASEELCWRQIKMTCDTESKEVTERFNFFIMEIQPKIQPYVDKLNKKLIESSFTSQLDNEKYFTYLRGIKKNIELFREENIPLQADINVLQQQFGVVAGKMTVEIKDQEFTLQQANQFLEDPDRNLREEVYRKICERRLVDKEELNNLYSNLVAKRNQIALNAGFENFRDYKFVELGRFDYTKEDCFQFHEAVKEHVLPLVNRIYEQKKMKLGLDSLRPWDIDAEPIGTQPLRPFSNGTDLTDKTIECFNRFNPFFAECVIKMRELGHLDLESRKGKAPGGYNCPLAESGAPFIFMNAAGQLDDVVTMVHEAGHAVHSFLAHELELTGFKEYPTEIAEVASMSMEFFSMDYWDVFFNSKEEFRRAKEQQLERVITILPWVAIIDKFQHWVFENPHHDINEREAAWMQILDEFSASSIDFSGLEEYRKYFWQRQLHLFEVPFYYIEYGIAQLGAIGMWQQFKKNPSKAVDNYLKTLKFGGTKPLPDLFKAAELQFNFSPTYISELMQFVHAELDAL